MQDQELLECLDLLLAVEKAPDVRPALKMAMARSQAGMPLTGVVGGDGNNVDGNNSGGAGGGGGQ